MSKSVTQNNQNNCESGAVLISPHLSASSQVKSPLQLGVMASGSGTNFAAVAKAIAQGKLNAEIKVLIYNKPRANVKELAEEYQIPSV